MALPNVYTAGSVTLTFGSAVVVGIGTAFSLARAGDRLWTPGPDGRDCRIGSISDDTHLTLAWNWPGLSQVAGPYEIVITSDTARMQESSRQLFELLQSGNYATPDAVGTLAQRAAYDAEAQGFIYWQTDVDPFLIFVKESATSGDWSTGQELQGPPGEEGPPGIDGTDGTSFEVNAVGPFSERADYDAEDAGFSFLSTTDGPDPMADPAGSLYIRVTSTPGTWSDAVPFGKGETGDTGATGPAGATGSTGAQGDKGWGPRYSIVTDGARRVLQLTSWIGGAGTTPTSNVNMYVGATGYTNTIGDAVDIRGPQGVKGDSGDQGIQGATGATGSTGSTGATGAMGYRGWSPRYTLQTDGTRRVLQLSAWVGGEGTTPTDDLNKYVGAGGMVTLIGDGIDVRGIAGLDGTNGSAGSDGLDAWSPVYGVESDGARRVLKITTWAGGEGSPPATGYVTPSGGVDPDIANGADIRGPAGAAGAGTGNMLIDDGIPVVAGEIYVAGSADPTDVVGSGVILDDVLDDITDLTATVAALPDPLALALIFGA